MIKLIIAGGRDFSDYQLLQLETQRFLVEQNFNPSQLTIISGKAQGADSLGEQFARKYHFQVEEFPADWNTYGKRAGYLRNEVMAHNADALIAIWDGYSKGTKHMIDLAKKYNLKIYVYLANEI